MMDDKQILLMQIPSTLLYFYPISICGISDRNILLLQQLLSGQISKCSIVDNWRPIFCMEHHSSLQIRLKISTSTQKTHTTSFVYPRGPWTWVAQIGASSIHVTDFAISKFQNQYFIRSGGWITMGAPSSFCWLLCMWKLGHPCVRCPSLTRRFRMQPQVPLSSH